ncbi:FUSC family protein [Paraburkholderia sp. C35]|uniref:FUSC family protein n=1 Tax=Paraburkholderia sp. C35 TaxID=2126993 RepID=UPI000D68B014|nr:FUSC family protein [Paraburkholderia sp. C35]
MREAIGRIAAWIERVDPGAHRRVKGLRIGTAYGGAIALGSVHDVMALDPIHASLAILAGGFALWASVFEARGTRYESTRDLVLLCAAAAAGAWFFAVLAPLLDLPLLQQYGLSGGEWILLPSVFLACYLRRYGVLGMGVGLQLYIGGLLAYGTGLKPVDTPEIGIALLIAIVASVVPRLLSGPGEKPTPSPPPVHSAYRDSRFSAECIMGLQATATAVIIIVLNSAFGLVEPVWAITAGVCGTTVTAAGTVARMKQRIIGTLIGVPLGLACLPLAAHAPLIVCAVVALALIVYVMALPDRYDIACGAFSIILMITLAVSGEHSVPVLVARAWETLLGGAIAMLIAVYVIPLRPVQATHDGVIGRVDR